MSSHGYQEQVYSDKIDQKEATRLALSEKSENELALGAPFVVLMKQNGPGNYLFIAYSMGRPRNIVWGDILTEGKKDVNISFGCNWNDINVINKMLHARKTSGFYNVSTYAKDRINMTMFGHLIATAYQEKTGVQYKNLRINMDDVEDLVNGYISDGYNLKDSSDKVALSLLKDKNFAQIMTKGKIPDYVITRIHHFLGHNPTLAAGHLPIECPLYEDCSQSNRDGCGLYGVDFELL